MTEFRSASRVTGNGTTPTCAIAGDIDIRTVDEFRAALGVALRSGEPAIVDLSRITFFGVAGLRALVDARDYAAAHHISLWIIGSHCVERLLAVAGLSDDFGML
ncbi:STAS domain-containing protein [Nocardia yamanashiensis]|uniref:STAS domain-containing protein n=1 Tax=Nocardia yamanashiensis TaxID=209247 RepID=UPI001E2A4D56|nr:STAS domain-containing protein [Nocardia yamanashiensis]UGT42831.1 STAS domain-containing protein [Nocardia yamanashiensis]